MNVGVAWCGCDMVLLVYVGREVVEGNGWMWVWHGVGVTWCGCGPQIH